MRGLTLSIGTPAPSERRGGGGRLHLATLSPTFAGVLCCLAFGCQRPTVPNTFPDSDLPRLRAQLRDPDPGKRAEAIDTLAFQYSERHDEVVADAAAMLADPDPDVRSRAATAFAAFSVAGNAACRAARSAKPALVRAIRDRDAAVRSAAVDALSMLGDPSKAEVLAIAACLADPDVSVRREATISINYLAIEGSDLRAAIPALEAALTDSVRDVRCSAALALGRVGSTRPATIAGLIRLLPEGRIPGAASAFTPALSLGRLGPAAKSAEPALRAALKDRDALARATAAWALWRVSSDVNSSVPTLVRALSSRHNVLVAPSQAPAGTEPDRDARRLAAMALLEISRSGESQRKVVDAALKKASSAAVAEFKKAKTPLIEKINARGNAPRSAK
jgi:HEAT repeat protein